MTTKSNTNRALAQATGGVLLAIAADDLGIVPANKAEAEATKAAQQSGEAVTLRDPISDQVLGVVAPGGDFSPAKPDRPPHAPPNRRVLTELYVKKVRPRATAFLVWDLKSHLVLRVQPSGHRSFSVIYNRAGRTRWYDVGGAGDAEIGLADARKISQRVMLQVAEGKDPQSERKAERSSGTFAELADQYLEYAKHEKKNKSWAQGRALILRYALPRWKTLQAVNIGRADVKALMSSLAERPVLANAVLSAVSAIFSWSMREDILLDNPCKLIVRNKEHARERVLSDSEVALFFKAFGEISDTVVSAALKTVLLTGQRGGEVRFFRREHLKDGYWEMPGEPVPSLGWPGTKNGQSHRVWIPQAVQKLIAEQGDGATGFVFAGPRGHAVRSLDGAMREICAKLGIGIEDAVRPHDLRRTHGTMTAAKFGESLMNRIENHKQSGIFSVYNRHQYAEEIKTAMEYVANRIISLVEGRVADNVVSLR